jgi:hypothetical protein
MGRPRRAIQGGSTPAAVLRPPSLHRHYPASSVVRASPPPPSARPVPHGPPVGTLHHAKGLPVLACVSLVHMPSPLPRRSDWVLVSLASPAVSAFPAWVSGSAAHRPFRGLLSVHSRYGLHTRWITQGDPLHQRLQPLRYLHDCSDCFRLERKLPGGTLTHRKDAALARRTPTVGDVRLHVPP